MNCKGCGQPMLPKGAIKKPNEYDHAQGCPFDKGGKQMKRTRYVIAVSAADAIDLLGVSCSLVFERRYQAVKFLDRALKISPICRNCEYWDSGGEQLAKKALIGDCLNPNSPRFTPEWDFSCDQFLADTSIQNG